MKQYLQIVTTPTSDTPGTTCVLHFDGRRYLIGNVSEGTQRACADRGVRMTRLSDVFITGKTEWANNGGMLGFMITLADVMKSSHQAALDVEVGKIKEMEERITWAGEGTSVAEELVFQVQRRREKIVKMEEQAIKSAALTLHGAPNLAHLLATARTFVCRKGMPISIQEYDDEGVEIKDLSSPTWSDDHLMLWAMPISPSTSRASTPRSGKRSYNEYKEVDMTDGTSVEQAARRREARATCGRIVTDMFNTEWHADVMEEMPLAQVPMPATIFVRNEETGDVEEYGGPKPGYSAPLPDINVLIRKPWPGVAIATLPPTSPSPVSLSYFIRSHDLRGKFDVKKAQEHKVKKGPDYRLLTEGESVTSTDGQTITPDMVIGESRPGKGIAFLDVPSVDYIEPLLNRPEWKSPDAAKNLEVCIWTLGPGVGEDPRLREFMTSKPKCKHIISSADYCSNPIVFKGAGTVTAHYAEIDKDRFRVPAFDTQTRPFPTSDNKKADANIQTAQAGLVVDMEPKFKISIDDKDKAEFDVLSFKSGIPENVRRDIDQTRRLTKHPQFKRRLEAMRQTLPDGDAEIIPLGTGSAIPSRYRNVSGTLVRVPGQGSYLLDAGEGTLGQLKRALSPSEFKEVMRDLKMIWISHLHADHHLGTVSVIKAWHKEVYGSDPSPSARQESETDIKKVLNDKRLFVVSGAQMLNWLAEYAGAENYGYDKIVPLLAQSHKLADGDVSSFYTYMPVDKNGKRLLNSTALSFETADQHTPLLRKATGLQELRSVNVAHCVGARAVTLVFPSGLKISYSGDCRPNAGFVKIGQQSTVLIHEATFEDVLKKDAVAKRHSTVSEALMVGKMMDAKIIVLTHFSQRYREIPDVHKENAKSATFDRVRRTAQDNHWRAGEADAVLASRVRDIPATDGTEEDGGHVATLPRDYQGLSPDVPVVLAFDYMRLKLRDAPVAEAYMPVIRKYLRCADVDDE